MNSQTQIRTALASVRDKQAAKVMKVGRTEECETELFFFFDGNGNTMVWDESRMCHQTSLVLPLVGPEQRYCHSKYRNHLLSGYQAHFTQYL